MIANQGINQVEKGMKVYNSSASLLVEEILGMSAIFLVLGLLLLLRCTDYGVWIARCGYTNTHELLGNFAVISRSIPGQFPVNSFHSLEFSDAN